MNTCTRCGITDRPDRLRMSLVNLEREAKRDRRPFSGPPYSHEIRCRDRMACDARVDQGRTDA